MEFDSLLSPRHANTENKKMGCRQYFQGASFWNKSCLSSEQTNEKWALIHVRVSTGNSYRQTSGSSQEHVAVIWCERLTIFRRPRLHWIWGTAISFIFISLVRHRFLQGWVWKAKYSRTTADFLTAPSELPHPTPPPADSSTQAVVQPAIAAPSVCKTKQKLAFDF